jgi:serine palmitoyltransferase
MMLYVPSKIELFHKLCMERGLAVVTVGFPAVPLNGARTRFCISAAHTREQLEDAVKKIDEVVGILRLRYVDDGW